MVIEDFKNGIKDKIDTIEQTINNDIMIKLINGKQYHKLRIYKANNILGYKFKVCKTMFSETQNIFDFVLILERFLNMNITEDFRNKIVEQLKSLNYGIVTNKINKII